MGDIDIFLSESQFQESLIARRQQLEEGSWLEMVRCPLLPLRTARAAVSRFAFIHGLPLRALDKNKVAMPSVGGLQATGLFGRALAKQQSQWHTRQCHPAVTYSAALSPAAAKAIMVCADQKAYIVDIS